MPTYPKRLIEVDLPIKRISQHARREKSIRHGHISTLHIWWARRPLAACRAVICAALWPDPADPLCPQDFRDKAARLITDFATKAATSKLMESSSRESLKRWMEISRTSPISHPTTEKDLTKLRSALLDFIADFANWDNSAVKQYLETSRGLTQAAHEALGGEPGTRPLVVDPFAGGGSIPLEALRVGADVFASDLNPVAVLLNKVVLEYIPKYRQRLADEVRKWGEWIKKEAERELAEFYPKDPDGATPIAYIWGRTIRCQGPRCGYTLPLVRSMSLTSSEFLSLSVDKRGKKFDVDVVHGKKSRQTPTVKSGSATCPSCEFTTPAVDVRKQLSTRHGGARDAQLLAVYCSRGETRYFRSPSVKDIDAYSQTESVYNQLRRSLPSDAINPIRPYKNTRGLSAVTRIGINQFKDLYNYRQAVSLVCFIERLKTMYTRMTDGKELNRATYTLLALAVARLIHQNTSISRWQNNRSTIAGAFGKQALQITWDFAEVAPIHGGSGSWTSALEWILLYIDRMGFGDGSATVVRSSATEFPLPNSSAHVAFTDPPYFAAIPYSDLAGFFYAWEKGMLSSLYQDLFSLDQIDQRQEIVVTNSNRGPDNETKDEAFYRKMMTRALSRLREVLQPDGIATIVFAESQTESWESILSAIVGSGWTLTSSWPIDTELQSRTQAANSASLQSSIHLVCRPKSPEVTLIGDWREVLAELPRRIREWMPRLAQEGVVGADAIFACLGPALEIFSRYSRVETAAGEGVPLGDVIENGVVVKRGFLSHVWEAIAKEALNMIFEGADVMGFEEDARLTAMWLWTMRSGNGEEMVNGKSSIENGQPDEEEDEEESANGKKKLLGGYVLEYDAARKIAQGLGAHLERLESLVEVKGDKARLLPVEERAKFLFGKDSIETSSKRKKKERQLTLFEIVEEAEETGPRMSKGATVGPAGTVLDSVHKSMLLFATNRSEALRRFLVGEGVGRDQRFWKLAQSLVALYPMGSDEKRWVEGVMARKKGLGL